MNKLQELINKCKNSVTVQANDHRDYYMTIEDNIAEFGDGKEALEIDPEVYKTMIETDQYVSIQFYPRNATGFYKVYHYDVELALDECLKILETE